MAIVTYNSPSPLGFCDLAGCAPCPRVDPLGVRVPIVYAPPLWYYTSSFDRFTLDQGLKEIEFNVIKFISLVTYFSYLAFELSLNFYLFGLGQSPIKHV